MGARVVEGPRKLHESRLYVSVDNEALVVLEFGCCRYYFFHETKR